LHPFFRSVNKDAFTAGPLLAEKTDVTLHSRTKRSIVDHLVSEKLTFLDSYLDGIAHLKGSDASFV
jgi:hypothetical protein